MTPKGAIAVRISLALVVLSLGSPVVAKDYLDSRGRKVVLPLGDASFADEVVSFERGNPSAREADSRPAEALGPPNYDAKKEQHFVTLGCSGSLTLRFTDNALIDVEGPDLHVFEVGPDIEPTDLLISVDGEKWIRVGKISGGRAAVDIAKVAEPNEAYHFVRLTDMKQACKSRTPGADIDAIAAIGTGLVIALNAEVLFDVDQSTIKESASRVLAEAAQRIQAHPGAKIVVNGHTDSTGGEGHNEELSRRRADAVRDFLLSRRVVSDADVETHGYGESRPIAPNDTDANRQRNRRVEIIILPDSKR